MPQGPRKLRHSTRFPIYPCTTKHSLSHWPHLLSEGFTGYTGKPPWPVFIPQSLKFCSEALLEFLQQARVIKCLDTGQTSLPHPSPAETPSLHRIPEDWQRDSWVPGLGTSRKVHLTGKKKGRILFFKLGREGR